MCAKQIEWGEVSPPNEQVRYDHVIGMTPLGRVLITWKGWKKLSAPTIDEMPGCDGFFGAGYDTVQEAMVAAQAAFDELIGRCITDDNVKDEGFTALGQALHQRNLLADTLGQCLVASGMLRPDMQSFSGPDLLFFGADLCEQLKQRSAQSPIGPVLLPADREKRCYVAGPMTGLPEYNFPAFFEAEALLRAEGWHVENPAQHGVVGEATWADYMLFDLGRLVTCSTLYLLPNWSKSRGASIEVRIARELGLSLMFAPGAEGYSFTEVSEDTAMQAGRWISADDVSRMAADIHRAMYPGSEPPPNCLLIDVVGEAVARLQRG